MSIISKVKIPTIITRVGHMSETSKTVDKIIRNMGSHNANNSEAEKRLIVIAF